MRIKYPVNIVECIRFRLYDFTTCGYIGNQTFVSSRLYEEVCGFARLYASFTLHRVGVTCVDKKAFLSREFERFCIAIFG